MKPKFPVSIFALFAIATSGVTASGATNSTKGSMEPPADHAKRVDYVTGVFEIEPAQSSVTALAPPARGEGRFKQVKGNVTFARPFTESKAEITLPLESLETGNTQRDQELRGKTALDAAQYPELKIVSKGFSGTPSGFKMNADVTLKGKTEEVVFAGNLADTQRGAGDRFVHQIEMTGTINPKDFGVQYEAPGNGQIGKQVILKVKLASALRDKRDQVQTPPTK
jgi:polyisoprenoid-binding protein YceI